MIFRMEYASTSRVGLARVYGPGGERKLIAGRRLSGRSRVRPAHGVHGATRWNRLDGGTRRNDTATTEIYTLSSESSDLGGRRIIRSEERRGGEEGRSRGSAFHLKKNTAR